MWVNVMPAGWAYGSRGCLQDEIMTEENGHLMQKYIEIGSPLLTSRAPWQGRCGVRSPRPRSK